MADRKKNKETRRKLTKSSLILKLENKSENKDYLLDLVEDYMVMWDIKEKLQKDISTRGVSIKYNNGGGQSGVKKNDSVDQLIKMNAQMLKLLSMLGIKPSSDVQGELDLDCKL